MTVLLVDWLGRGGIAQTTEAWALELADAGIAVRIVTRGGRELATAPVPVLAAQSRHGRLATHQSVVMAAVRAIEVERPQVVVVQNYVLPPMEWPVFRAATRVGAKVVLVVHDHRLHTRFAGSSAGLRRELAAADTIVAHTAFVAEAVGERCGRDVTVLPHPLPLGMLARARPDVLPIRPGVDPLAIHFGVLRRTYKGSAMVLDLARNGVPGWRFALVGEGAPTTAEGAHVIAGFVDAGLLVAVVARSDVTLLPYRFATQSGAIVLAHAVGSVPVASAVGGIPEQIEDGVTGRLVPAGALEAAWRDALMELSDPITRRAMAEAGRRGSLNAQVRFADGLRQLMAVA